MGNIKKLQALTEKENELLKVKLEQSETYIASLKEDMGQVQKATWENRNFRIEMKEKLATVETHLQKTVGFDAKATAAVGLVVVVTFFITLLLLLLLLFKVAGAFVVNQ